MARPRRILLVATVESAKRTRRCRHNPKHTIAAGERCLVLTDNMQDKSYCLKCAIIMLDSAREQITILTRDIDPD